MSITAVVILVYLVFFAGIGIYLSRGNRSAADWAIGGGTLGVGMLAAGVAGTRIGGAGTYGVAGDVINEGVGHLLYSVNSFAALFLVACFSLYPIVACGYPVWVKYSISVSVPVAANGSPASACRLNTW
jgi:Na+/proline symporter